MASWNSIPLHVSYEVLGWVAFVCWSISFYPQVILNFRRKSVVGLNFDFVVLNLTKHTSYLIYNASLYFSSAIQKQYKDKYGQKEGGLPLSLYRPVPIGSHPRSDKMIPVAANDVAFSSHAVLLTAISLFQIAIYDRGGQKVSKIAFGIVVVAWLTAAVCLFVALHNHHWLWLLNIFGGIQICMTIIKYIPQAVMNFLRKSTDGWSIGNILLDFSGGIANYLQMVMQSLDQGSWVNFYGNIGKLLLSLVSVFFDFLFMCQHYLLYPAKKCNSETSPGPDNAKSSDRPSSENV